MKADFCVAVTHPRTCNATADALADLPGGVVTMSAVVKQIMAQCPSTIGAAQIVEEVVKRAATTGVAIDFDKSVPRQRSENLNFLSGRSK